MAAQVVHCTTPEGAARRNYDVNGALCSPPAEPHLKLLQEGQV